MSESTANPKDITRLLRIMARLRDLGVDRRVFLLAGVGPLASAKAARWMRSNVPGIHIPDAVIERMEKAAKPAAEGKRICVELIQQIREIKGVSGIHVMAYRREHQVSEIILESGVLKGRVPQRRRSERPRPAPV